MDDRAFAETYARELFQRKRYGARRVRQELSRKGVGRDIIDQVLEQYQDMDQAAGENIALVLERRYPTWREDEKARRRAVAALQRLGYSFEQVRAVMGGLDTESRGSRTAVRLLFCENGQKSGLTRPSALTRGPTASIISTGNYTESVYFRPVTERIQGKGGPDF